MKLLPSEDADSASEVIGAILAKACPNGPSDARFSSDYDGLWTEINDGGWFLLGVDLDSGGAGLDLVDLAGVLEIWGRHLVPEPFLPTLLLWRWSNGNEAQLPTGRLTLTLSEGERLTPFGAYSKARIVTDLRDLSTRDPVMVNGEEAEWAPSLPLLRGLPATTGLADKHLRELSVLGAAELVGCGAALRNMSVAYARQRVQFGKPIIQHQAVQGLLADMHMHVEMARTAVVLAANEPGQTGEAVALAWDKIRRVAEIAVQVHGGFGFTWEAGLHFFIRHIWAWREIFDACGTPRRT